MVSFGHGEIERPSGGKLVAVTSFRFAERCSEFVIRRLEESGYDVIPFHAQGVGEDALENLLSQGLFQGVIDLVPAGLSEQMFGGNRAARPERLEAAGAAGIPQVIAPSGFDMISCGPIERKDAADPLWQRLAIATRQLSIPDRFRVEARTTADEVAEIGKVVAAKLNQARGPACVIVPTRGWSSLSVEGGDLYAPEADAVFVPALKQELHGDIPVIEVDAELNSEACAAAAVDQLVSMMEGQEAKDMIGTTLAQHLIEEQRNHPTATGDLTSVINDVVTACKAIAAAMRYGALSDEDVLGVTSSENVSGETQKTLDVLANHLFLRRTEFGGHVAAMVSEEMEDIYRLPGEEPSGRYLLLYDPVDGSSNIDENAAIGTVFSILKRDASATGQPVLAEFLQPGTRQVCAGYAIYGPSTMIVISTGNGSDGFTLDPLVGEFVLTHPKMQVPRGSKRFFVNSALRAAWDEPVTRYINECISLDNEDRFDHRWSGCAVADVHRLLMGGGIYLNPSNRELRRQGLAGKLRLLYEVNPLAMIVEQAGGTATTGDTRVLDIEPESLHQRCPVVMGSKNEVAEFLRQVRA